VFNKYPLLALFKEALVKQGARVAMMSGSGSTTFAVADSVGGAEVLREHVLQRFGTNCWSEVVAL
jgi:4-diphosphocytidyl-2C-methyl-D-erythritol kinase